jgi:hypothetical protein
MKLNIQWRDFSNHLADLMKMIWLEYLKCKPLRCDESFKSRGRRLLAPMSRDVSANDVRVAVWGQQRPATGRNPETRPASAVADSLSRE